MMDNCKHACNRCPEDYVPPEEDDNVWIHPDPEFAPGISYIFRCSKYSSNKHIIHWLYQGQGAYKQIYMYLMLYFNAP